MGHKHDKVVRFWDRNSEDSTSSSSEHPLYPAQEPSLERRDFGSPLDVIRRGFQRGSQGIRSFGESLSFQSFYYQSAKKKAGLEKKILDPQGLFLQRWNKIFLFSCVFALAWDPLFLYIPVIDGKKKCLKLNDTLGIIACVIRTFSDLFYLLHIIIQFRTGFISPSSRVLGRGELIKDPVAIAKRYISSFFFIDVLAVLPFPQMAVLYIIPRLRSHLSSKSLLKIVIFSQYFPRIFRIHPLYKEVTRTSGILTETAWAGAAFNMFLYMLASHVVGAVWYLFSIDRQDRCWRESCHGPGCQNLSLYCKYQHHRPFTFNATYCNLTDPDDLTDPSVFNFGMFYQALDSQVVESNDFFKKLFYCFWWGLQNLSSLGQNLKTSTFIGENLFASFICVFGLVLFSLLIGNMQKYLQSTTVRIEEMRVRRQDAEQWMSHRMLPEELRERIRRYEQYKWQETRGVDEENVIQNLPKDLRRDLKRHLCLALLMRVPMFEKMDEQLLDAMCDRLKPVLYTENSIIVREGDPVNEMLFIMRGRLLTMTTNGGRTGFFNSVYLDAGDFCGEELLTWALDPHTSSNLPISTRTVQTQTEVEAFALMPDDLKFVASQFRRLHSKQLRHTFTHMDISSNSFTGDLPASMSSLTSLKSLYMQNNQFTGTINVLADLPLQNLNVANNKFTGWIPRQLQNINLQKGGNSWSSGPAPPSPPGTPSSHHGSGSHKSSSQDGSDSNKSGLSAGAVVGIVLAILVVGAIVGFVIFKRRLRRPKPDVEKVDLTKPFAPTPSNDVHELKSIHSSSSINTTTLETAAVATLKPPPLERHKSFDDEDYSNKPVVVTKNPMPVPDNVKAYSIADLQIATGSFSVENLIGEGSIGRVYRAQFDDGKVLAVKKIDSSAIANHSEDFTEIVANISRLHHPNVTELVGYCSEHGQHLLIYEFHKDGSLNDFLHLEDEYSKPLTWNTRVKIALGSARALEYLHEVCSPSVVHQNFKSENILLDAELNPHLSDCGLASLLPNANQAIDHNACAPEVADSGQYTLKSDVYSFGVVMLELLTGRKPFDSSRTRAEQSLIRWATPQLHDIDALTNMVDPALEGLYPVKSLSRFADVIALCVQPEPEFRPPMSEVVQALVRLVQRANMSKRTVGNAARPTDSNDTNDSVN